MTCHTPARRQGRLLLPVALGCALLGGFVVAFSPSELSAQPVVSPPTITPSALRAAPVPPVDRSATYRHDVVGWMAWARVLTSSGFDQFAPSPKQWPRTAESYGRRFATRSAQLVAIESTRHGVAALLQRHPDYQRCECEGVRRRLRHAAFGVVTDFDEVGQRRVGWPRFAGALAGAYVLGRVQPGQGAAGTVAFRALNTVALGVLGNVAREFAMLSAATPERPVGNP